MKSYNKILIGNILFYLLIIWVGIISVIDVNYYVIKIISGLFLASLINIINGKSICKKSKVEGKKIEYQGIGNKCEVYIVDKKAMGNHNVAAVTIGGTTIFIEEEVSNVLNNKELDSIIQHEYGHIKKSHGFKSFLFRYISVGFACYGWHLAIYENIKYSLPGTIIGVSLVFLCNMYIKENEYAADEYAINNGVEKEVLIHALNKISDLNNQDKKRKKIVIVETHPVLNKRIERIARL